MHKKSAFAALCLTLVISLFSCDLFAQSTLTNGQLIYVESKSLDTDSYARLFNALKSDADIKLVEACVPAHIFTVRVINGTSEQAAFEAFKAKANSILSDLQLLKSFDDELFMQRCSNARYGRN